jgi:tetratricopeptide (TPR) repeat protein
VLIAQLGQATPDKSGDWFYRTHSPGRALAQLDGVWVVDAAHIHRARTLLFEHADVLIVNMVPDVDLRRIIADRRRRGRATVFELNDDVANIQKDNPYAVYTRDPYELTKLKQLLNACDAVQFSTPELARRYGRFARAGRGRVLMNQMPPRRHARAEGRSGKLVIGWGGSYGHLQDLQHVAGPLVRWLNARAGVELAIMADPRLFDVFRELSPGRRRHVPIGDIDAYYAFLSAVDIGFAPLSDLAFNLCRSDVKFLEMALHGVAPVLQDLQPYRDTVREGETALLFRDPDGLVAALARLCDDETLRLGLAARAQAYVQRERSETVAAAERMALYQSILPPGDPAERQARARGVCEALSGLDGAEPRGRHLSLPFGAYEERVWLGLAHATRGERADALKWLAEAAKLEPEAYQPHLFSAMFAPQDQRRGHLEQALRREPASLSGWIDRGDEHDDRGEIEEALRCYMRAAEVDPTYDQAYAKTSLLLEKLGRAGEAREFGAIAARIQQPFLPTAG